MRWILLLLLTSCATTKSQKMINYDCSEGTNICVVLSYSVDGIPIRSDEYPMLHIVPGIVSMPYGAYYGTKFVVDVDSFTETKVKKIDSSKKYWYFDRSVQQWIPVRIIQTWPDSSMIEVDIERHWIVNNRYLEEEEPK